MKYEGTLKGISLDWKSGQTEVSLLLNAKPEDLEKLEDKKLSIDLKVFRRRRSLEANSYFYVLVAKIAEAIGQSVNYVHNDMLRKYGQIELIDGQAVYVVLPDTEAVEMQINESETYHLRPTSQVKPGKDGTYRTWMMVRGSHTYDSKEMSRLVDGIVSEAKDLGIETESPEALREMMERYGAKFTDNAEE